jgi:hypothetical protein
MSSIIKINVGDTNGQDSGMMVDFDNVPIEFEYSSGKSVHRYDMVV